MGQRRSQSFSHRLNLKRHRSLILGLIAVVFLFSAPWLVESAKDLWALQQPRSPEIIELAQVTQMTVEAQKLFYRQDPMIIPKEELTQRCPLRHLSGAPPLPELLRPAPRPEKSPSSNGSASESKEYQVTLGCYVSRNLQDRFGNVFNQSGQIYIQKIIDPRFAGLMESTAAHEMLHVAYARLGRSDRDRLAPQLQKAAQRVEDPNLKQILNQYKTNDLAIYFNELHSHLGVELENLGDPDLEAHYRRYFTDRQQVVNLVKQSQVAVNSIDRQSKSLEQEINQLETALKKQKDDLDRTDKSLELSTQRLDQLRDNLSVRANSPLTSDLANRQIELNQLQLQFNNEVEQHNQQVDSHQTQVASFREQVSLYREKVNLYNSLVKEKRSLIEGLSSENPSR